MLPWKFPFVCLVTGLFFVLGLCCMWGGGRQKQIPEELTLVFSDDSGDYNPLSQNFSWVGANFVGGSLMRQVPNGNWAPWVAQSVEWSGTNLCVKLGDRRHSDGVPVSVEDVAYSISVRADARVGGNTHQLLVEHAFSGVEQISETEVLVRFNARWAPARNFVRSLTIWKKSFLETLVNSDSPQNHRVTATELVGTGAYRIVEFVPRAYSIAEPTGIGERLRIRAAHEGAVRRILFAEQQADVIYIDQQPSRSYEASGAVMTSPSRTPVSLVLNMDPLSETGSDLRLREALLLATDSELLRRIAVRGDSAPGESKLYSGQLSDWNHPEASQLGPGYDLERANRLLDQKFPVSSSNQRTRSNNVPLRLRLITYDLPMNKIMSDRLAYELRRHLKIHVSVEQVSVARFFDIMFHRDYAVDRTDWDLSIMAWPVALSAANDPSQSQSLLSAAIPPNGFNVANLADEILDNLINRADSETDESIRMTAYHQVHQRLLLLSVSKPICHIYTAFAVSRRVTGYSSDENNFEVLATRWPERFLLRSETAR